MDPLERSAWNEQIDRAGKLGAATLDKLLQRMTRELDIEGDPQARGVFEMAAQLLVYTTDREQAAKEEAGRLTPEAANP